MCYFYEYVTKWCNYKRRSFGRSWSVADFSQVSNINKAWVLLFFYHNVDNNFLTFYNFPEIRARRLLILSGFYRPLRLIAALTYCLHSSLSFAHFPSFFTFRSYKYFCILSIHLCLSYPLGFLVLGLHLVIDSIIWFIYYYSRTRRDVFDSFASPSPATWRKTRFPIVFALTSHSCVSAGNGRLGICMVLHLLCIFYTYTCTYARTRNIAEWRWLEPSSISCRHRGRRRPEDVTASGRPG